MDHPFHKPLITKKLEALHPMARVAFIAAGATRLLPTFVSIRKDSSKAKILEDGLSVAWTAVLGHSSEVDVYAQELAKVMEVLESEPTSDPYHNYTEDAAAAVAYTLRALINNGLDEPTEGMQHIWESMYRHVKAKEKLSLRGPALVNEINKSPLIQAEFSRQFRDLDELANWNQFTGELIKKRAEEERVLPEDVIIPVP